MEMNGSDMGMMNGDEKGMIKQRKWSGIERMND